MTTPGFCVWLTGLSGAGKSTLATALHRRLNAYGHHTMVFDGDVMRARLNRQLGYTRDDRHANIVGVARLAADLVHASGVAICALMSPYAESRAEARRILPANRFLLVHVSTPLTVCEERDVKRLYARARQGEIHHVVGLDEPYEVPTDADLRLDTSNSHLEDDVTAIVDALIARGWLTDRTGFESSVGAV